MSAFTIPLTGKLISDGAGNYTVQFTGPQVPTEPIPPEPPVIPPDTTVITPTGGDDTAKIQNALNSLPVGNTLMLSGMFNVANSLWFDGYDKQLMGDPAKQSGMRSTNPGIMNGPYGALLCCTTSLTQSRIQGLEFDGNNNPTETVFFDGGDGNIIEDCYLHSIKYDSGGPPYGAIHSQDVNNLTVRNNRVERTTGVMGGSGVRGIWIVGRNGILVDGNHTKDTGHTGIAVDAAEITIVNNTAENSLVQGTGMKIVYRAISLHRTAPLLIYRGNTVRNTLNAGLMLENIGNAPGGVLIEANNFIQCGGPGTTFGALYNSKAANGVIFQDNRLESCRSVAGVRLLTNSVFQRSTIVSGSSNVVYLEADCHYITITQSGVANIGPNCDHITVDGKVVRP